MTLATKQFFLNKKKLIIKQFYVTTKLTDVTKS